MYQLKTARRFAAKIEHYRFADGDLTLPSAGLIRTENQLQFAAPGPVSAPRISPRPEKLENWWPYEALV